MYEERKIRRTLIRNTLLFFIVFAVTFAGLGVFVYQVVTSNIYRSADHQLTSMMPVGTISFSETEGSVEAIGAIEPGGPAGRTEPDQPAEPVDPNQPRGDDAADTGVYSEQSVVEGSYAMAENTQGGVSSWVIQSTINDNPQLLYYFRDADGALDTIQGIYSSYPEYLADLPFNKELLGEVYQIEQEGSHYRGINYRLESQDTGTYYIQAIINVDAEIAILDQFTQTLVVSLLGALLACAAASYFLSRRTIRPIAQAWNKQTEFVQNASHELRTPLTVIHTTQQLLLEDPHSKVIDHFEDITLTLEETDRLSRLTGDLLMLSAADSDKLELELAEFEMSALAEEVAQAYEEIAADQDKQLYVAVESVAPVRADRNKIRQVLGSLVDNALKYTEAGDEVTIAVSQEGEAVRVTVADTGIGVSEEVIAHAFDRFYRADKARSRTKDGLGLGLSIARSIVEAHQGEIEMQPNTPKGTKVTFTL